MASRLESDEDAIVEKLLAEAEQAALDLVGLGGERHDPSLDDTQRGVVAGDATIAIRGRDAPSDREETTAVAPASDEESTAVAPVSDDEAVAVEVEAGIGEVAAAGSHEVAEPALEETAAEDALEVIVAAEPTPAPSRGEFVASSAKKSSKYHRPTCKSAANLADNARIWFATRADAEAAGLQACKLCRKK